MRTLTEIRDLADQAYAENASGVIAGDRAAQAYLDGVEQALRWVADDGTTEEIRDLIRRSEQSRNEPSWWFSEGFSVGHYGTDPPEGLQFLDEEERADYERGVTYGRWAAVR